MSKSLRPPSLLRKVLLLMPGWRFRPCREKHATIAPSLFVITSVFIAGLSGCGQSNSNGSTEGEQIVGPNLYAPQNLPSNFTPPVPDSLQPDASTETDSGIDLGLVTGRRNPLDDGDGAPPTATSYIQLQAIIEGMRTRKRDVALNFVMADAIFADLLIFCAGQDTDAGCSIPSGELQLTFTEEMMMFVLASQGITEDSPAYEESAANYSSVIGTQLDVPQLLYTTNAVGYDHQLVVDSAFWQRTEGTCTIRWNSDRTRVSIVFEYGSAETGTGSEVYNYDDTEKLLVYSDRWSAGETTTTNEATLQADPARTDTHGLIYTARNDSLDPTNEYLLDMQGVADDNGGIVESLWSTSVPLMGVNAGLDLLTPGYFYLMASVAQGGCATVNIIDAPGALNTYDANSDGVLTDQEVAPTLWSSIDLLADPTSYVFCVTNLSTFEVGEQAAAPGAITLQQTGIGVRQFKFLEGFTGDGSLKYSGSTQCSDGYCGAYSFDVGDAEVVAADSYASYFRDLAPEGGGLQIVPRVEIDGEPPADTSWTIYFVLAGTTVSEVDQSNVIGYAWFDGPSQSWQVSWFGTTSEVATADGFYVYYDEALNEWVFESQTDVGVALQN